MRKGSSKFTLVLLACLLVFPSNLFAEEPILANPNAKQIPNYSFTFKDTPSHAFGDVKETFWNKWTLLSLAAGSGFIVGMHHYDKKMERTFDPEDRLGKAKDVFNVIGSPYALGGGTLLSFGISRFVDAPKYKIGAESMLEAYAFSEIITTGLKYSVRRKRPDGSDRKSFPSGHTSRTFALAAVTETLYGPKYGIPAFAVASMVALSRLDSHKHFLTDVLGGALIGTLTGFGTAEFHKKKYHDYFVVPTFDTQSAGVSLGKNF